MSVIFHCLELIASGKASIITNIIDRRKLGEFVLALITAGLF